jgi:hypothetical protein
MKLATDVKIILDTQEKKTITMVLLMCEVYTRMPSIIVMKNTAMT